MYYLKAGVPTETLIILAVIKVIFRCTAGTFSFSFLFLLIIAAGIVGTGGLVLGVLGLLIGSAGGIGALP